MGTFLIDAQELKPGLVLFRRSDVKHLNWYCRIKVPHEDRYKTISLKTSNVSDARDRAYDHDADVRFRKKHDVPIFDKSFADVAKEYMKHTRQLVDAGEMQIQLWKMNDSLVRRYLAAYTGNVQISQVGAEKWRGYIAWRRQNSQTPNDKAQEGEGADKKAPPPKDATIRKELIVFRAIMKFAAEKNYIRENQVPKGKIQKGTSRREEFTPQEYRHLHTFARKWIKEARSVQIKWHRTMTYNYVLIMANTGMRPTEAKNLRWCDVDVRKDRQERPFVVLSVHGKGKERELVAANNVAAYFERIREISKATKPDDFVFSTPTGKFCKTIYKESIANLLTDSGLLMSATGSRRCSYCFRHTYATFRLMEGIDVYFLAKQMGTSVKMIEEHYGHITPSKNAERILEGVPGWEPAAPSGDSAASVNAGGAGKKSKPRAKKRAH